MDKAEREERRNTIRQMYLQCYTAEEIGETVGVDKRQIEREVCDIWTYAIVMDILTLIAYKTA